MSKLTSLFTDTWRGMMQRRLWPVAILLLAALVAVPLLLTAKPEPVVPAPPAPAEEAAELAAQPLVAVASAAERESGRRVLGKRKDPFRPTNQPKRRRAGADRKGASQSSGTSASRTSAAPTASPTAGQGGGSYVAPAPLPAPTRPETTEKAPRRPAGSLSVRWGTLDDEDLEALEVERLDPLPTRDEPLLVYLGLSQDGRAAVFMLDAGVTVEGDGRCRPTPGDCQTVELEPGETEFIEVADENGKTVQYQLDLVEIHGRRAARTLRKDAAAEARATRRALRSLGHSTPAYRFDARAGTLKAITPGS